VVGTLEIFARHALSELSARALATIAQQIAVEIERAATEAALRESEARYGQLLLGEQKARAEAERAVRTREDLLAVVSHDLRNPLSAVMTSASFLKSPQTPERLRSIGDMITRNARRMVRMIEDLLDLAAIDAGSLVIDLKRHEAGALLREVAEMFGPLATEKQIALGVVAPDEATEVACDRERVLQVFSNLVGNALKFTPAGGSITVRALPAGEMVRFEVADTGTGIGEDDLPHIFDRYWQARKRSRDGIGLGLSIACGIVTAHRGKIHVESESGRGTTFSFTLPAA
jgi:signal transduction histidine kinase